jgi:hypothetical protein
LTPTATFFGLGRRSTEWAPQFAGTERCAGQRAGAGLVKTKLAATWLQGAGEVHIDEPVPLRRLGVTDDSRRPPSSWLRRRRRG